MPSASGVPRDPSLDAVEPGIERRRQIGIGSDQTTEGPQPASRLRGVDVAGPGDEPVDQPGVAPDDGSTSRSSIPGRGADHARLEQTSHARPSRGG